MKKSDARNTKGRIVSSAWELFYEQGYDNTTIEDIVERSETSKGSFYHYFEGKDALLSSLSYLFDEKYESLMMTMDESMNSFDKLIYLNHELFFMVENSVPIDLLTQLYASQLTTNGEKHMLNRNRTYYRVLRKIILEGQQRGQIRVDVTVNEIVKAYAMCERAILYDWCFCNGEYSVCQYAKTILPMFLGSFRTNSATENSE